MKFVSVATGCVAATLLAAAPGTAWAQASIQYGRITNVQMVTQENARAQTGGALAGGVLGASLGSGRSAGNRGLQVAQRRGLFRRQDLPPPDHRGHLRRPAVRLPHRRRPGRP